MEFEETVLLISCSKSNSCYRRFRGGSHSCIYLF